MTSFVMRRAIRGGVTALVLLTGTPGFAQSHSDTKERLDLLLASGKLQVDPALQTTLEDGRILSIVQVEIAPEVTEPHHSHPGLEVLYRLSGSGSVDIDGRKVPIETGTVVRVEPGEAKAISNADQSKPLLVLAVLVLDANEPALTVVDQPDGN